MLPLPRPDPTSPGLLLALPALFLVGCADAPDPEAVAAARFLAFQDALFRQDRSALGELVCRDARAVIPDLCRAKVEGRKRLVVTGVTRSSHEFRVHVTDPDQDSQAVDSFYVMTREDGAMRVDLLATASYHRSARPNR